MRVSWIGTAFVVGCTATPVEVPVPAPPSARTADIEITDGQTVYVPAYSHVYFLTRERDFQLAITLSVRNVDPKHPITVDEVQYFDNDGHLVTDYVEEPVPLGPMASTDFSVSQSDARGGIGANFVVRWSADTEVYEPVVEAVMVGAEGNHGLSLVSPGRVYEKRRGARGPTVEPAP